MLEATFIFILYYLRPASFDDITFILKEQLFTKLEAKTFVFKLQASKTCAS